MAMTVATGLLSRSGLLAKDTLAWRPGQLVIACKEYGRRQCMVSLSTKPCKTPRPSLPPSAGKKAEWKGKPAEGKGKMKGEGMRGKLAKTINLVETREDGREAAVYAVKVEGERDFSRMLKSGGYVCMEPVSKVVGEAGGGSDHRAYWHGTGVGIRAYDDLCEAGFYLPRPSPRLPAALTSLRRELQNRARGQEDEVAEAIMRLFCGQGLANHKEWRRVGGEEVDAVLASPSIAVLGFHCNKLTLSEAQGSLRRALSWQQKALSGSRPHSFLLHKDLYLVQSGNYLPDSESLRLVRFCKQNHIVILLRNGANFSMDNSLLPLQTLQPLNFDKRKQ